MTIDEAIKILSSFLPSMILSNPDNPPWFNDEYKATSLAIEALKAFKEQRIGTILEGVDLLPGETKT